MLQGFLASYRLMPLNGGLASARSREALTGATSGMFLAALQIAGPMLAVLLLADIGLGLLTRAAPALNAFSLGFPLKILITLAIVGAALVTMPSVVHGLVGDMMTALGHVHEAVTGGRGRQDREGHPAAPQGGPPARAGSPRTPDIGAWLSLLVIATCCCRTRCAVLPACFAG